MRATYKKDEESEIRFLININVYEGIERTVKDGKISLRRTGL